MNTDFHQLERTWMAAVQQQDTTFLEQLLDARFVCTAWSSTGELTAREEYLTAVRAAEFGCCDVTTDHVEELGDTAIVRCRLQCECMVEERPWSALFLVTDVWQRSGGNWQAVSRHASVPFGQAATLFSRGSQRGNESVPRTAGPNTRAEGA